MSEPLTANDLHALITDRKFIDVGGIQDSVREAIDQLREVGHTILVGVKYFDEDGRESQLVSFGNPRSAKASVQL